MGNKNQLTNRQKEFAKFIVEGIYSNSKCARMAGYAEDSSHIQASKLLNGKDFPLVTEYIKELREEREKKYGVTLIGQLKRFSELSHKAEQEGQFSASVNAEKIRSALGGLSVDKREVQNTHKIDQLSRDEIVARLSELRKAHSYAFEGEYKRIDDAKNREVIISNIETKSTKEDVLSKNRK
tara:strand:+ start:476 stop:1021 length:546 start_codon:yes stop_codon:yes gene_type:complete